jgi:hypothetical protein
MAYIINPETGYRNIKRINNNSPPEVRAKLASPEWTKKRLEGLRKWREANPDWKTWRKGQPNGVRRKDLLIQRAKTAEKIEKVIKIMADKKIWIAENDMSEKAMKAAIEIMECATGETRTRLHSGLRAAEACCED